MDASADDTEGHAGENVGIVALARLVNLSVHFKLRERRSRKNQVI